MGTPVKIRAREEQCVGAGEPTSRPMTEEEMKKYYTEEEIEEMANKITPPAKEKLIEVLAEKKGKTNAVYHACKTFKVSAPTVLAWIKDYGIKFDDAGMVIRELVEEIPVPEEVTQEVNDDILDGITSYEEGLRKVIEEGQYSSEQPSNIGKPNDTITITGQETKEIPKRLGYAEHDVGNAILQIDFRQEFIKIETPSNGEMSFEEAIAAAELILDILDHE